MTIYAHSCPDLTLVDLPGITKMPLPGQPKNIEEVTKNMCKHYCRENRTIILCVCSANVDLTTQDSIVMATDLDPDGERTLGVLTKVDIMNKGSDCSKILRGEEIPLRYGYVAVKGRSMQDMKNGMTMTECLQAEREWFDEHPIYSNLPNADECLGTDCLVNKLSTILSRHIKKNLPLIIEEIE